MAHSCKAVIVHCIDFRFINGIRKWFETQGLMGLCDVVSVAGSAKLLASDDVLSRDFVLSQLQIALKLHNVNEVILLNHKDCGAYKLEMSFNSEEHEREVHAKDLEIAAEVVLQNLHGVTVRKMFAKLSGGGGVSFIDL